MVHLLLSFRHWLYDHGYLRVTTPSVPTICVGNLAVGGTGKTPHVEYLIRLLTPHYRVAVLSRGYGRSTRGFVLADDSASALTLGDEPMQIHRRFPSIPLAVCADRVEGIRRLMAAVPDVDVVILDDAFQHRAIRCGFNILLTAYDRLYVDDRLLPWGRLRDLPSRALAAQAVVVTHCPDELSVADRARVAARLHLPSEVGVYYSRVRYADMPWEGCPLVVTGIAHPEYLMAHLAHRYPEAELMAFSDHHRFTPSDVRRITRRMADGFDFILTTDKDYVRLMTTPLFLRYRDRIHPLPIEVSIDPASHPSLDTAVLRYVDTTLHHHSSFINNHSS